MSVSVLSERAPERMAHGGECAVSSGAQPDAASTDPASSSQPPHAPRRHYSNSESETTPRRFTPPTGAASTSQQQQQQQRKRHRQAHHHHQRHGKRSRGGSFAFPPAGKNSSLAPASGGAGGAGGSGHQQGKHGHQRQLPLIQPVQQPKAPSNTTQFLIKDMEERESAERDTDAGAQPRPRSFSAIAEPCFDSSDSEQLGDEEAAQDPDFLSDYDSASMQRIEAMTRDQVDRELLEAERCNRHMASRMGHLRADNHRLKALLQQHGIVYSGSAAAARHPSDPLAAFDSSNRSVSTESEEARGQSAGEQEEEEARTDDTDEPLPVGH